MSLKILIVEDGDEYLDSLSRFVAGPTYIQRHSGAEALATLAAEAQSGDPVDLVYLDMRFDRIPEGDLLGDHAAATRDHNGDAIRAWRYLANHQGLFILNALKAVGHTLPVILSYDFSREAPRLRHLQRLHPNLHWVPDAVTPPEIRRLIEHLT